jgi:uncharacterized protein (DUF2062 family)
MNSRRLRESPSVNRTGWGTDADIGGRGNIDRKRLLRALAGVAAGVAVGVAIGFAGLGVVVSLVLLWLLATACAALYILSARPQR